MGIACPKCCLERGREAQRAGIVLTREKKKQKQINPPDPSPSALQTGLFTITTNSCLQVTMTTGSVPVSSESRKTDTFQGQTQCLKKKKGPHPALLYKQVIEYQPKFEVPSVLRLELGPP